MEEALHSKAWCMRSALVCVCVVRSTLFHCLFSTYICTYVYTYVYMCMVYYSGFFFSVLFCVYSVWYPRASTSLQASTHLQSIITLLHPLPLLPVATITLSSLSVPCIPSVLSPSLTFTSCPSPLSYTPPQHPPTDLALGRNCSLFLWSPFATGPLCTCRAGVCPTAGLTTPTTSGGECLQFWQHGWPLHCAHRIHNSVTSQ